MTAAARRRHAVPALAAATALLVGWLAPAYGHAFVETATPAANSVLPEAPTEVVLELSEPAEVRFSIFKVYRLDLPAEATRAELAAAITTLIDEVLERRDDADAEARVDRGVVTEERTSRVVRIGLEPDLPAGRYLVMWRVLSVDTHTSEDFLLFTVDPTAGGGDMSAGEDAHEESHDETHDETHEHEDRDAPQTGD